ncbi:M14 metallopeptidase family protein [Puia dinghuensis]|uniref:Peptidase M14 n=1 Tax=Puia dinghuensis TaxID=1792502 RepID=A0A8J2XRK2_9BACT|nr:M14 metallopeptidase family protein [Puia dinghuensis]GGA89489.1 peptidase M14 [Puia dinghuensis]
MKSSLFFGLLLSACCCCAQNPPSPDIVLGYPLGAHFTPHDKIAGYFQAVARAVPDEVKLEQYGTTYEGRPLLLAYIASPENLRRLEDIRQNNLRLAGVLHDNVAPDEHGPVIVWLSYNVHGNEPASSEAAMKTLYQLVSPASARAKEWLQHVVIIIDPCINPDGRDRYVHWYNDVVGVEANPDPQSREHQEPWPRGRTNHYNFDLNRDWAWQTQVETQQRLKKYNAWLPQVHVDYHEQGYNNPYYFAPAAEPYHDVITPWQREFQTMIGKNNAHYFDRNGWLYFTKEEFDLFYPSYGDTYPIYNGAIGMTFEQGGIGAGLAVLTADGDTLTLAQRLEHHFTTGISTIEIASANAERLIKEYHKYFIDAVNHPGGEYKAYYLRNDSFGDRLERLKAFLERNGIRYVRAGGGMFTGVDYESGRPATFKAAAGDIVVNANQPKSNLVRVLFEPKSRISDSITYDITAWSVPYVYGVQAYGLNGYVNGAGASTMTFDHDRLVPDQAHADTSYAYAIRWTGMGSVRFLTQLLQKGIKVRYAERAFQSGGISFDKGTLLVTATGNRAAGDQLWPVLMEAAHHAGVMPVAIASGFVEKGADFGSGLVHLIHRPRVALLTGDEVSSLNAGEVWHLFEQEIGYPVTLINAASAGRIAWKDFDVVILPNGNYQSLQEKNVAEALRSWVREGGRLIAMQNAVEQLAKMEWGIRLKGEDGDKKDEDKDKKGDDYADLHQYGNRQREEVASSVPGSIYKVELDNSHPLAFGYPDHYYTLKEDDKEYEFLKGGGWNVGVIRKDGYVSGFTGNKAKERLKDVLVFGAEQMGRGSVVYMADDPLFRSFWENGKLLFCNAVFLVGQ